MELDVRILSSTLILLRYHPRENWETAYWSFLWPNTLNAASLECLYIICQ